MILELLFWLQFIVCKSNYLIGKFYVIVSLSYPIMKILFQYIIIVSFTQQWNMFLVIKWTMIGDSLLYSMVTFAIILSHRNLWCCRHYFSRSRMGPKPWSWDYHATFSGWLWNKHYPNRWSKLWIFPHWPQSVYWKSTHVRLYGSRCQIT